MEYCQGGDLFTYLENRGFKLAENKAAAIIHKLAVAVYYLHSYGVTHRDIKPENILMTDNTDEADIKLLDFGLSKIIGPQDKCTEPYGTVTYVAPEILSSEPYDKSVDLWSIGVVAYFMLTGVLPFDGDHETDIIRQVLYKPVLFEGALWEGVSDEGREFVESI
jgi:serine/threonine protein kinase